MTRYAREYGDVVPLRLGVKPAVLLSHPDDIESVLVTHNRAGIKSPTLRNNRRLLGHGLLTSEGDFWRRQRRLSQPAFHRERLASYGELMIACTERAIDGWAEGEVRDVHADMMRLTMEIVGRTLFGADVVAAAAEVGGALEVALERFDARVESLLFLLPDTWPLPGNLAYLRAAEQLDRVVFGIIERRRRDPGEHEDLLATLLEARDEDGSRMSDQQLRDEVMTLFLAGHETTAITLSWTWYLLATHPEVERKLLAELREVLGERAPTVADAPRLKYAERVVSEVLRLYPPAWFISREAIQPFEVRGYRIAKGQIAMLSQWVVHRDPRFWDRPDEFDPDRWAPEATSQRPRYAYFPFGGGPRLCIGAGFAMMEAVLVLATILQRFHLALVPGQDFTPWPTVTLRPRHGVRVVPRRREQSEQTESITVGQHDESR
jgi:cytochrome P450